MDWQKKLTILAVSLGLAGVLPWSVGLGRAEPLQEKNLQETVQSKPQDRRNTGYEKRQDAKKRLQAAVEARKAQRLAAPDHGMKGGAK